ncbi:PT domain-containing protein [Actinosynnema sp. NPDC049800]
MIFRPSAYLPTYQPTSQPTNQPTNQPTDQPARRPWPDDRPPLVSWGQHSSPGKDIGHGTRGRDRLRDQLDPTPGRGRDHIGRWGAVVAGRAPGDAGGPARPGRRRDR